MEREEASPKPHEETIFFFSVRFCTVGQVTLANDNGHLSARFCVMRRKRRRLLDLSMRVTVYNPLTASSCWRMAAVLTELRGTQKRVAVDAPPYQSPNRSAEVSLLFSSRWHRQGHLRRVCCPPLPVERTMRCRGDKKRSRTLLFHCSLLPSQAIWKG